MCHDRASAGVVSKDYLSLIRFGETALSGIHSGTPAGLEAEKRGTWQIYLLFMCASEIHHALNFILAAFVFPSLSEHFFNTAGAYGMCWC